MSALGLPTMGLDEARVVIANLAQYDDPALAAACVTVMTLGKADEFDRALMLHNAVVQRLHERETAALRRDAVWIVAPIAAIALGVALMIFF